MLDYFNNNTNYMTCAVVMAAYNGEKYILEQLNSIAEQYRQPDEFIALDDGSTDGTVHTIERFINDRNLGSNWKLISNDENLGYVENFLKGCELVESEVVFFSDQDDIWLPDKIEIMMKVIENHEDALVVACDTQIINQDGKRYSTLQVCLRNTKNPLVKVSLEEQVKSMLSSGLTLAVRTSFIREMIPIIRSYKLVHDSPLGLFSAARGGFYRIGQQLVLHRVHTSNASSPSYSIRERLSNPQKHIEGRIFQLRLLEALEEEALYFVNPESEPLLRQEIERRKAAISAMNDHDRLALLKQLFCPNPMSNSKIELMNLLVCGTSFR